MLEATAAAIMSAPISSSNSAQTGFIASIQRYFDEEMDDEIGTLKASLLLDFFLQELGPTAYNIAVADAQAMLTRIVDEGRVKGRGVIGCWPANAVGDDIELYLDEARTEVLATVHTLRQQGKKSSDRPNFALADFVAPKDSGVADYFGGFAVSTGFGVDELAAEFEAANDDYNAILIKALADRLAEAFAERMHQRVRMEFWGYAPDETLDNQDLISEKYQGIRPAPGYPACPDHTEKAALFELLDASNNTGITLTQSFAMHPAAAVSGWYFWRPEARYFGVGKIGRDQVEDYARRKGMALADIERWLAPNLGYQP